MFGRIGASFQSQTRQLSTLVNAKQSNPTKLLAVTAIGGAVAALWWNSTSSEASGGAVEDCLTPPSYPWSHRHIWSSFDHASIRRGFQVYNQIGSACHGMRDRYYRQLVNVAYTEDEVKEIAAEHDDYAAAPDEEGEVGTRPGLLTDRFWSPYKNEPEARYANNGALPPDLTQIVRGRVGNEDYIFALLTGYRDPPHGVKVAENMYYNIYFPGGQIAMPPPLAPGAVTYDDGTDASISQMAKDVTTFLTWSAFMELDERHLMGIKTLTLLSLLFIPVFYWKKFKYALVKKRQVAFLRRNQDFTVKPKDGEK